MSRLFALLAACAMLPLTATAAQFKADAPTVIITGAGRGIGYELASQYAAKGWNVIATSRRGADDKNLQPLTARYPNVAAEMIDVTKTDQIKAVAEKYRNQPIDVLINNAAAVEATFAADMEKVRVTYDKIDYDAALYEFDVNTVGPMRMIQAFMPSVMKSRQKKIVNVTSLAGSFGKPLPGSIGMNYGASKAGLNKYSTLLATAMDEQKTGVTVALVQPIFVASKADKDKMPNASPIETEVAKLVDLIGKLGPANHGKITNFQTFEIDPF